MMNHREAPFRFMAHVGMMGWLAISLPLDKATPEELAELKQYFDLFKKIRHITCRGEIHRIASLREHPYAAFEFVLPDAGEALRFVSGHGLQFGERIPNLLMESLDPGKVYDVEVHGEHPSPKDMYVPKTRPAYRARSGRGLMEIGIHVDSVGTTTAESSTSRSAETTTRTAPSRIEPAIYLPGDRRMYPKALPALVPLLTFVAFSQTPEQNLAAEKSSMLDSSLGAGMPDEILFAVRKPSIDGHWYANIAYYSTDQCRPTFPMNSGGKLCIYNVKTEQVRTIFEDPEGNIRDPQVHYDAKKLVFAYLPKGKRHYSLYEINIDGTGLKQLTGRGEDVSPGMEDYSTFSPPGWDDYEPTYLPNDEIIFCSTRANRYVQCWMTQVGTLYKCNADGSNLHALSANVEHDNTPWVLSNGQVAYMRWEYVDRFHMGFHHLWSMNPDGTRQMVLYGNQINHGAILAPKPIPHSPKVVVTWSPGHGRREHYGRIALIDPRLGPDDPKGVQYISRDNVHCDPWALSEQHFLVANKTAIEMLNGQGETEVLYRLPEELAKQGYWIGEPRPVMKREREPVVADAIDPTTDHGTLALVNIYKGRKMRNVKPGTIKNLLVYEVLPKPINYSGAMSEMSAGGTFSVERLIGSVPVSEDGSAYFKLPAVRSFLFLAMDEKGHCVKRMHSFTSVMPGETTTCIGCHEPRTETPSADEHQQLLRIMRTQPVTPEPVAGVPEIFDFLRDIQPILDQHCLECHNHDREEGGFNISGHWGPLYPIGYIQMSWRELFGDNRVILPYSEHSRSNFEPYEIGTGSSRLLKLIEEGHEGVDMPEPQQKIIRHWLDAGANHAGTYAVNSHGTIGYYLHSVNVRNDKDWPETQAMVEVMNRRCDVCHAPTEEEKKIGTYKLPAHFYVRYYPPEQFQKNRYVAHTMSEDGGRFNRHVIFNLSYPELSKAARAPLAKEAGGLGVCEAKSGKTVFRDKNDPDYQAIVAAVARGRKHILEENNRFCMINPSPNNGTNCPVRYVPRRDYVREMIRYGVLPVDHDFNASVDPFELDKAYWKTFWYAPKRE